MSPLAMHGLAGQESSPLRHYLRVLRRRAWLILLTTAAVTAAALLLALRETKLYAASAAVLLNPQNVSAIATGTQAGGTTGTPESATATQARLARVTTIAARALKASHVKNITPSQLLAASTVAPDGNTNVITFRVVEHTPELARLLATEYAREFTRYRHELDTRAIAQARREIERRIRELGKPTPETAQVYGSLVDRQEQLKTIEALQVANVSLVQRATGATQTQPRTTRSAVLGFLLGLVLGLAIAFLRETLDTRVRTAEEVTSLLHVPLLARIPKPPRRLRSGDELVMQVAPRSPAAEAFRVLRNNLDFVNLDRGAKSIMVTSAVQGEGKSTTVANLALALARSGRKVTLVDLDLRRPYLHRFFDLDGKPGMTNVAVGHAPLDAAATRVPARLQSPSDNATVPSNGSGRAIESDVGAALTVIGAGAAPPDPGEFMTTHALTGLLDQLAQECDFLLIDAPPLLGLGDAMALAARVDAMIVISRLDKVGRPTLTELRRVLDACPVAVLGYVLAAAEEEDRYGYGPGGYYYYRADAETTVPLQPVR